MYFCLRRGDTWTVYEQVNNSDRVLLHNLKAWQAKAIVAILNEEDS